MILLLLALTLAALKLDGAIQVSWSVLTIPLWLYLGLVWTLTELSRRRLNRLLAQLAVDKPDDKDTE